MMKGRHGFVFSFIFTSYFALYHKIIISLVYKVYLLMRCITFVMMICWLIIINSSKKVCKLVLVGYQYTYYLFFKYAIIKKSMYFLPTTTCHSSESVTSAQRYSNVNVARSQIKCDTFPFLTLYKVIEAKPSMMIGLSTNVTFD